MTIIGVCEACRRNQVVWDLAGATRFFFFCAFDCFLPALPLGELTVHQRTGTYAPSTGVCAPAGRNDRCEAFSAKRLLGVQDFGLYEPCF